jgi:hypothetical protein
MWSMQKGSILWTILILRKSCYEALAEQGLTLDLLVDRQRLRF